MRKESLEPIVKSRLSPFSSKDSMQGVGKRKGKGERIQELRNIRKEVRDPDVKRELRKGGKLITYVER